MAWRVSRAGEVYRVSGAYKSRRKTYPTKAKAEKRSKQMGGRLRGRGKRRKIHKGNFRR